MTGTIAITIAIVPKQSKMEKVHRNPRWRLFGHIRNGRAVQFWNAIQNWNHSTSEQILTIQNLKVFSIRTPAVFKILFILDVTAPLGIIYDCLQLSLPLFSVIQGNLNTLLVRFSSYGHFSGA